jgi:hypothetical protein
VNIHNEYIHESGNEYLPKNFTIRMNMNLDFSNSKWTEYLKNLKKNAIRVEAIWIKRNSGASASQDELDQASFPLAHPGQFTGNLRDSFGNHIGNYAYLKVDTHRFLIGSLAHISSNAPG